MNAIDTLKQIVELRAKATGGPWVGIRDTFAYDWEFFVNGREPALTKRGTIDRRVKGGVVCPTVAMVDEKTNLDFIAIAGSTDWPALLAEVQAMCDLVDKLPKTADGVPVIPGVTKIYFPLNHDHVVEGHSDADGGFVGWTPALGIHPTTECYSTREAAEQAARKDGAM